MESTLVKVELLGLIHTRMEEEIVDGRPHAFAYHIRITNHSGNTVTLDARKWILEYENGNSEVYEGDRIVGEIVRLQPGEEFEYNSYHLVDSNCTVTGAYHGFDDSGSKLWVRIPKFHLHIPDKLS